MRNNREYTVIIQKQEGAKGYWAKVPTLPGCFSTGDTVDEALRNAKEAIVSYIEALEEQGDDIPKEKRDLVIGRVKVAV